MNTLKTAFYMTLLTVLLIVAGGSIFGRGGLVVAFALALVMNGVAYFFSDKLALKQAGAEEISPADAPMLHRLADRLAVEYHVPKPRVYVSPDPSPNAFATGRNPSHAAICVNAGLLNLLNEEELYGVLAHEFGHVHNRDILISSVVAVLAGTITFLAHMAQWAMIFGGGRRDDGEGEGAGGAVAGVLMVILAPIAAVLIQLAISRAREYQADATGARVSGRPDALASALRKLERGVQAVPGDSVAPTFSHLYIVNPFSRQGLGNLFSTHPPLEERIARLEAMQYGSRIQ
jgi:heat shock protein HtpX